MNKRNLKSTILAAALVVVLSIGGIMAYFTDFETVTNSFTFGMNLSIFITIHIVVNISLIDIKNLLWLDNETCSFTPLIKDI